MIVTEYTALCLLVQSCRDRSLLRRVLRLVPDMREWVEIDLDESAPDAGAEIVTLRHHGKKGNARCR